MDIMTLGFTTIMAMVHTIGALACGAGTTLGAMATMQVGMTHGLTLGTIHGITAMLDGMVAGTTLGIMVGADTTALGIGVAR